MKVSNSIRSKVLTLAHAIKSDSISFSQAQKKAWAVVRLKYQMQKNESVEFEFVKKDGTTRPAIGTLNSNVVPLTKGSGRTKPAHIVTYFDLERQAWRSFKAQNIKLAA